MSGAVKRSSRKRRRGRGSERGAILLISMVLMTSLLLMSAAVVDIGRLSLERRADQTAADIAVISGAMSGSSNSDLIEAVRSSLDTNLHETFTLADLNTCGGDSLPAGWVTYPLSNCIARDRSGTQLRVRVPTKAFPTAFALLAGLDEFEHSAFAQVYVRRQGNVLPFAVDAAAGSYRM
ncbi:MAG: pilus assembly protein TadG-related protein [Acidimicrobiales bacterium]